MFATLLLILAKMTPIYGIALGGFLAGGRLRLQKETLARLLIYFIAPVVFFSSVAGAPHGWRQLLLVPVFLCIGSVLGTAVYVIVKKFYPQQERGILGFIAGSGNTGYFGIPLVAVLLGPEALVAAIMITIGLDLFQYTVGYYLMTRHNAKPREALLKIARTPIIWGFIFGLLFMQTGWQLPPQILDVVQYFKGAYIVLGMLVVGIGLADAGRGAFDMRFVAGAFAAKFVVFPLCIFSLVIIDQYWLHLFSAMTHQVMLLLSLVPIASDAVAFATLLGVHPQKTAHTVVLSSVFSVLYVPILAVVFRI